MQRQPHSPHRYLPRHRVRFALTLGVLGGALVAGVYYLANPVPGESGAASTATALGDWPLTLVNEAHPLPEGFAVEVELIENQITFDRRAAGELRRMLSDARGQGLHPMMCSGYRSVARQQELYDEQVAVEHGRGYDEVQAFAVAKTKVALPGASEHNLGLAADIVAEDYEELDAGFENTPECQWLTAHCAEYGFIPRYPKEKSAITGIQYEPWHFRYVGRDAAAEIVRMGVCLEEYLRDRSESP